MITASTSSPPKGGNAPNLSMFSTNSDGDTLYDIPYDIPHLENDGNNYLAWKVRTQTILKLWDIWGIVNGDIAKPDPSASPNEFAEWKDKDVQAHAQITFTIKDVPLHRVYDAETSKECWDGLSVWYKETWEARTFSLLYKVFRSTLSDAEPLGPQIDAMMQAARTVTSVGPELDDKLVAYVIISSLPASLSDLKTILSSTNPSELSTEHLRSQIIFDEHRRVRESGMGTTAFFRKAGKKGKGTRR